MVQRSVRREVAAQPKFNREHCEGCQRLLSRGSLRNVQVTPETDRKLLKPAMFQMLCRECEKKGAA
jgi:RNase P subunit RPR2